MKRKKNKVRHKIWSIITFILGVFIIAIAYNTLIIPNDIVVGGTTGIAIILNKLFGISINLIVLLLGIILLFISLIFLGYETTRKNFAGTIIYPIMLAVTVPIGKIIVPYLKIDDFIVIVILAGTLLGLGCGLVYKAGYSTGGFDVIMQLVNKNFKVPEGTASKISNMFVVLLALPIIGLTNVIYSAFTLIFEEVMTNKLTIGVSDSKIFFIYSRKIDDIRDTLVKNAKIGFTIIPTVGGYSHYKGEMLMCVLSTRDYYAFREIVLSTDPNAFFVINDCYEVNGGVKRQHLPFL